MMNSKIEKKKNWLYAFTFATILIVMYSHYFNVEEKPSLPKSNNKISKPIVESKNTVFKPIENDFYKPLNIATAQDFDEAVKIVPTASSFAENITDPSVAAQRIEGWRLFTKAERILVCARWMQNQSIQRDRSEDQRIDESPLLEGMDANECWNKSPYDFQIARDEIQRAAMMGDLDARYEILNERFSKIKESYSVSGEARFVDLASPQETAQLREELNSLANAGNRQAAFMMANTLSTGELGVKDPITGAAWLMASIQPSGEFDPELARRAGPFASASEADQARLMKISQEIYNDCCKKIQNTH